MRPPTLSQLFLSLLHSTWCQQITLSIFVGRSCLKYWCVVSCWSYCLLLLYHAIVTIVAILNSASKPLEEGRGCFQPMHRCPLLSEDRGFRQSWNPAKCCISTSQTFSFSSSFRGFNFLEIIAHQDLVKPLLYCRMLSQVSSSFQAFVQALTMCCTELPVQECALSAQNTCDCGRSCCPGRGLADGLQGLGFRRVSRQKGNTRAAIATGMGRYILFSLNLKNVLHSSWPWASETF